MKLEENKHINWYQDMVTIFYSLYIFNGQDHKIEKNNSSPIEKNLKLQFHKFS